MLLYVLRSFGEGKPERACVRPMVHWKQKRYTTVFFSPKDGIGETRCRKVLLSARSSRHNKSCGAYSESCFRGWCFHRPAAAPCPPSDANIMKCAACRMFTIPLDRKEKNRYQISGCPEKRETPPQIDVVERDPTRYEARKFQFPTFSPGQKLSSHARTCGKVCFFKAD